ncbi:MAG TPA: MFS transporter [Acidimicrobiales bacterium]|nr:MFS transporter [Acidimicrobiales bacterium]
MTTVTCHSRVSENHLARFFEPRDDLVTETRTGEGTFVLDEGPFHVWLREVTVDRTDDGDPLVTEATTFRLAVPFWGLLFRWPLRRRIVRRHRRLAVGSRPPESGRIPAWLPPDRLDARSAMVLATISSLSVVTGYLGTIISQTITYSADQFGATTGDQGNVLAAVRIGVLGSLAIVALADRRGRRKLLLASIAASCVTAAFSAVTTSMWTLAVAQTVSRAFSTAAAILLAIVAAEEMPRSSRAYAVGVMTLAGGLGAGVCVWFLPLADTSAGGWRWLYVIPLVGLYPLLRLSRVLPETRRFIRRTTKVALTGHGSRLLLVGAALFAAALFATPASQLQNTFLDHERDFSAARIALFTVATSTPAALGVAFGGRLADTRGRRLVGGIGVLGGSLLVLIGFFSHGWTMWAWTLAGTILGGAAVPAIAVYGPELFPTALRGKANGILQVAAVAGSSAGLLTVGALVDHWGRMGPAMAVMLAGPVLVAVLLGVAYPETAHRTLEEVNPEDATGCDGTATPV